MERTRLSWMTARHDARSAFHALGANASWKSAARTPAGQRRRTVSSVLEETGAGKMKHTFERCRFTCNDKLKVSKTSPTKKQQLVSGGQNLNEVCRRHAGSAGPSPEHRCTRKKYLGSEDSHRCHPYDFQKLRHRECFLCNHNTPTMSSGSVRAGRPCQVSDNQRGGLSWYPTPSRADGGGRTLRDSERTDIRRGKHSHTGSSSIAEPRGCPSTVNKVKLADIAPWHNVLPPAFALP